MKMDLFINESKGHESTLETAVALEPYQSYSWLSLLGYLCLMLSEQHVQSPDHILMLGFVL